MITLPKFLGFVALTTVLGLALSSPATAQFVVGGYYAGGNCGSTWGVTVGAAWSNPYPANGYGAYGYGYGYGYPAYGYVAPAYGCAPAPVPAYRCAPAWRPVYRGYGAPRRYAGPPRRWGGHRGYRGW